MTSRYAELQVTTNFSFLRGASHPEEMAGRAAVLGLAAVAVTDRNTLAGVVRAHGAAKEVGVRTLTGARLDFSDAPSVLCLPTDRAAYGRLARLITLGRMRAPKGECDIALADFLDHAAGQIAIALAPEEDDWDDDAFAAHLRRLKGALGDRLYLAASFLHRGDDARRIARLARLADRARVPAGRDQRRRHARAGAAGTRRRGHLHPRALHHRRRGLPPRRQCRAPPEAGRRDGAAVPRPARGRRPHGRDREPHRVLARRAALRISRRRSTRRHHARCRARPPRLGRRDRALSAMASPTRCAPRSPTSSR